MTPSSLSATSAPRDAAAFAQAQAGQPVTSEELDHLLLDLWLEANPGCVWRVDEIRRAERGEATMADELRVRIQLLPEERALILRHGYPFERLGKSLQRRAGSRAVKRIGMSDWSTPNKPATGTSSCCSEGWPFRGLLAEAAVGRRGVVDGALTPRLHRSRVELLPQVAELT